MIRTTIVIAASAASVATAAAGQRGAYQERAWDRASYQREAEPAPHRHWHHAARRAAPAPRDAEIAHLRADLDRMRHELDAVRARVEPAWPARGAAIPFALPGDRADLPPGAPGLLASLPDLRLPGQPPAAPVPLAPPPRAGTEEADRVREARAYLVATATPGYTMTRLSPEVSIGRLHPAFAVRLAAAVRQARGEGLSHCGVFSAYRPPAFGVGGFSDKFNSLHSYGLAVDVTGIGSPGSREARRWEKIVRANGLSLPYGPRNRAEFNHTQLMPTKVANAALRRTITAQAPRDLPTMWLASGVRDFVEAAKEIITGSAKLLPDVNWGTPNQN